jgi:hypothetical protein
LARRLRVGARLRFLRRRFWRRWDELIFAFDIQNLKPATARVPVTFKTLTQESVGGGDIPELELVPQHEVLARLRRGHLCAVAIADGKVIQYSWFGVGVWNLEDIGIFAPLEAHESFLYDVYASEHARGGRIFLALAAYAASEMIKRGYSRLYTRIRRRNVAALVGTKYFGFTERLELNSMRILSSFRVYDAVLVKGSGIALQLLTAQRTRMGAGILLWRAGGHTGYRINLPSGHTIMPAPWVPAPNGKS